MPRDSQGNQEVAKAENLRKKRKSIKSKLTNFKNFLNSIQQLPENSPVPLSELEIRLNRFESLINEYEEVQDELDGCPNIDEVQEENYRRDFENIFYPSVAGAKSIISKLSVIDAAVNAGEVSESGSVSLQNFNVKLPTIEIPKFSGKFENWLDFHDSFDSLIVKNSALNEIQKFHYLKASISGNASKIISSMPISADNFRIAWELISERYSNKSLLVHSHIKAIFNLPKIVKENGCLLRQIIDGIQSNLRSLQSLGEPTESWDSLLIYIILSKLDQNTEREWELAKGGSTFQELLDFLKGRANILESRAYKLQESSRDTENSSASRHSKPRHSKSFISNQIKCQFCSKDHKIINCADFLKLNINQRSDFIKQRGLCLNCFHPGHVNRGCKYGKCRKCGMKHHTLLHIDTSPSAYDDPILPGPSVSESVSLSSHFCETQTLLCTISVLYSIQMGKLTPARRFSILGQIKLHFRRLL